MVVPLKEPQPVELTEEQKEEIYWGQWKFDSHKWIEYQKGYYRCAFCQGVRTSTMAINDSILCSSNPAVVELMNNVKSNIEASNTAKIVELILSQSNKNK